MWGGIAAASLLVGALISLRWKMPKPILGLTTAFGVGILISAISFELVEKALAVANNHYVIGGGLLVGSLVFFLGTAFIERLGHGRSTRQSSTNSPFAIFIGTALDGIPESIVLGLSLINGGAVSIGMLIAVFISNIPEAIAATSDLQRAKWRPKAILLLWLGTVIVSAIAAFLGFSIFDKLPVETTAFTMAFAAGALITMLADAMMPTAYRESKNLSGIATTIGFGIAFIINRLT